MIRTCLDDAEWASLWLAIQGLPRAWKRDEGALRRFVEAALWICRTGAPWRDLPAALGHRASVYHRRRRWCLRGWWALLYAMPLLTGIPARDAALDRGYVSAALRAACAAQG